jgi:hypothetical protein
MKLNRLKVIPALILAVVAVLAVCCRNMTGPSVLDVSAYGESLETCRQQADARAADDTCRAARRSEFCARWPNEPNCDGGIEQ